MANNLALLVVDMQDSFLKAIPNSDALVTRCSFAIEAAALFGIEIIFTEQIPEKLKGTNESLLQLVNQPKVFSKSAFSALNADGINEYLREKEIHHILLAGVETPICIYQSALQALNSDCDVTLVSDIHSGRRGDDVQTAVESLRNVGIHYLPSETIFFSILQDAQSPLFKSFSNLVKKYASG